MVFYASPVLAFHVLTFLPPLTNNRALHRLINRRDVLSTVHENLNAMHTASLQKLTGLEVENLQLHQKNQELVRELLSLTEDDESWREYLDDPELKSQLEQLEADHRRSKARWEVMKSIASAIVVGSEVNWAEDETLTALVLDESDE